MNQSEKVEKLKAVKQVYFHDSCPDGTTSAFIVASAFRALPPPEFIPIQHGTDFMENLVPQEGQMFIDICPPKNRWEEWVPFNPIVLDHHETTKHVVVGLGGVYGENETHSGAMLAFEEVFEPLRESHLADRNEFDLMFDIATYAMIRDTWKKDHDCWVPAQSLMMALQLHGSKKLIEEARSKLMNNQRFDNLMGVGKSLLRANNSKANKLASNAHVFNWNIETSKGPVSVMLASFNCTDPLISETGNLLVESGVDVAIGYFYLFQDGRKSAVVSLRTNEKYSASDIAKANKGGGHPRAAGFNISYDERFSLPPESIERQVIDTLQDLMGPGISVGLLFFVAVDETPGICCCHHGGDSKLLQG